MHSKRVISEIRRAKRPIGMGRKDGLRLEACIAQSLWIRFGIISLFQKLICVDELHMTFNWGSEFRYIFYVCADKKIVYVNVC